jgi:fatty-acid desaturase
MNRAGGNVIVFVVVMIVVPWALIWLLRSTGRRWGDRQHGRPG